MSRIYQLVVLVSVVFVPVASHAEVDESAVDLGTLELDLDSLKHWGTRRYTFRATAPGNKEDVSSGTIILRTEITDSAIMLRDEMTMTHRGKKLSLSMTHHCQKNNYLSPLRIESTGKGDDELGTFVAVIDGGKATVTRDGRERVIDIPSDTVPFSSLQRIVTILPRKKGTRISFKHWLESSELHLKKNFLLESMGQEAITRDDRQISCTKYRLTSKQIHPLDLWVGDDGVLQRMLIDERKLIDLIEDQE